jgi:dimethylargininase
MIALTHLPSPHMADCQLTHVAREAIDCERALAQHAQYCRVLAACGVEVRTLDVCGGLPDCAFIEDTAIVLDEAAILCSLGTPSRRAEPAGIEPELRKYREVHHIELPATIEGGDVLRLGRKLLVGQSSRTNAAGIEAMHALVRRYGYDILAVPVGRCLHLKTACTALPDGALVVNPAWLDTTPLSAFELLPVPAAEPWAANLLPINHRVCLSASHLETAGLVRQRGFEVHPIQLSEFAKAEAGVTCLSLLL